MIETYREVQKVHINHHFGDSFIAENVIGYQVINTSKAQYVV